LFLFKLFIYLFYLFIYTAGGTYQSTLGVSKRASQIPTAAELAQSKQEKDIHFCYSLFIYVFICLCVFVYSCLLVFSIYLCLLV
jgi:hypothetical protein